MGAILFRVGKFRYDSAPLVLGDHCAVVPRGGGLTEQVSSRFSATSQTVSFITSSQWAKVSLLGPLACGMSMWRNRRKIWSNVK